MKLYFQLLICVLAIFCSSFSIGYHETTVNDKIDGVNFVAPRKAIGKEELKTVERIGAEWVGITPYAYTPKGTSELRYYNDNPHWWGEGINGALAQIQMAHAIGYKVMLKPHVWVMGEGWPGAFDLASDCDWEEWELSYEAYILELAELAEESQVSLFCIGTELKHSVVKRPEFWEQLIKGVRSIYCGKLTYAANWDNYENVTFWNALDFVGIDAYFPLSDHKTPSVKKLMNDWNVRKEELGKFSVAISKPILFTEYGYRSSDYCTKSPWDESDKNVNIVAQCNAYKALYQSVWNEQWMAGGFLWKWHSPDHKSGGLTNSRFTPQNKMTEEVIREHYCK